METTTRPNLSIIARVWAILAALALLLGMLPVNATAQDTRTADPLDPIWNLIPGDASAVVQINTDPAADQWRIAADLLDRAGLEDAIYGAIDEVIDSTDLAPANFVPGQSSILGGSITLAAWGDRQDPTGDAAVYIRAANPEAAYRSLVGQLITESGEKGIEVEIPGGRMTVDESEDAAIMLLDETVVLAASDDAITISGLVTGAGPTLADFEPFTRVMSAQTGHLIARAYGNGPAASRFFGDGSWQAFGVGAAEIGLLSGVYAPLSGAYTSLGLSATDGGFLLRSAQLPAPVIGPPLPGDAPSADLAAIVSNRADLFIAGTDLGENGTFTQLVDSLVILAATSNGEFPEEATFDVRSWAYDEVERATSIDVEADLLGQLAGDFLVAGDVGSFEDLSDVQLVVSSEIRDADQLQATLIDLGLQVARLLSDQPDVSISVDRTSDSLLYVLTFPDGDDTVTASFGIFQGRFIMSFGEGERLLNPEPGNALGDDPEYRAAIAKLPVQGGSPVYLDLQSLITIANLTSLEPPSDWDIENPQHAPLDGIRSLVGMTYEENGLAMTDLLLEITAAPPVQIEATPESTGFFIPDLVIRDATAVDVGNRRVLSIAPDGSRAVVRGDGDELCVVPLDDSGDEHCTDRIHGVAAEHVVWSQDSTMVALSENAPRNLVDSDIWTINAETGDVRNLTDDDYEGELVLSDGQPGTPDSIPVDGGSAFTPDGAEIIFSRTDWSQDGFDTDLYRVSVAGGEPEHIAPFSSEPFVAWHGAVWQDDTTLLLSYGSVSSRQPNNGLWSVDIDSGDARQVWHGTEDQYNATPVMFLPDGRLVVRIPYNQAVYSIFMDSCPYIVLDLATDEEQPIRDGNGYCARVVGVSPGGATAVAAAAPDYGFWFVDLTTFDTSEATFDSVASAVANRRATSIAGAGFQHLIWTDDNVLIVVINDIFPVRVQLEFAA